MTASDLSSDRVDNNEPQKAITRKILRSKMALRIREGRAFRESRARAMSTATLRAKKRQKRSAH